MKKLRHDVVNKLKVLNKKLSLFITLFLYIIVFSQTYPDLEMGGPAAAVGLLTNYTTTLQKDTNNNASTSLVAYSTPSPLTVNYQVTTTNFAGAITFGDAATSPYQLMSSIGNISSAPYTADNAEYTGYGVPTNGTGIQIDSNYALYVLNNLATAGSQPGNGRVKFGEITITYSRGTNNPIMHFKGLGGASGTSFTAEFTVKSVKNTAGTEMLAGTNLSILSGTNLTVDNVTKQINNSYSGNTNNSTTNSGRGSIRFQNNDIKTVVLEIYTNRNGANATSVPWSGSDAYLLSTSVGESDLQVTKTVNNSTPLFGSNVVFTIVAKNNGSSNNTNIQVNDLLPSGFTYSSHTATSGTYVQGTGVWTIPALNDGASSTLTITATVNYSGVYTNTATISSTGGLVDPSSLNNTSSVTVTPTYSLALAPDSGVSATGTSGVAFTVPNVLSNDLLNSVTPVIGSNPGQVAISQSGVWPSGISLNTATGQVNVGASVPAGTYNVTYQVCVNGSSPTVCSTTTVTITVKLDTDGDGISDDIDLDDDNDGILDTVENNCPPLVTLTNSNTNFSTLLAAGTVTVGGVNITATRTGTVSSFNGDAYIGAGAQINPGFSGTFTNAGGTSFNTPVTSASLTLNFSQPISTFTASFKGMQDEEQITFSQPATSVVNLMNSTYGVAPSIMSLATLVNGGLELRSNLSGIVNSNTSSSFGSNSVVTWNFPVPVSSLTINHTGVNRGTGVGLTNYNGSIIGGDFTFAQAVACTPLDTDGDGIINSLDTDSDGDGCPDAIEGAGNITASQITSGHINGGVDVNGVPTASSGGQALGQSQDASKNDCSDVDADGVPDWQDLDDDNDGILDTVEAPCTSTQAQWSHNASGGQSDFVTFENDTTTTSPNFTSGANITFGAGLNEATDNYAYTYLIRGASTTNFVDAKTANDYAQVSYTPSKKMTLKSLNFGYYTGNVTDPEYNCGNFRMAVEYSTNSSFTSPTLLLNDVQVGAMSIGYLNVNNTINNLQLQSGNTYYFRIYIYNEQNSDANNRVRLDDVFFTHCLFVDTDGDGISDDLDIDSDGDGCPDAIEGAGNITTSQVTSGHINGGVDANGVPTAASGGQALGQSQDASKNDCLDSDGDSYPDWQDLDDDNDGILDTVENACAASTTLNLNAYNNQSPAVTVINSNNLTIGNSVVTASTTYFGSGVPISSTISDTHYTGESALYFNHSGTANSFANRIQYELNFSQPINNLTTYVNDLDDADNIIVNAYDENNNLITISTTNYTLFAGTIVSYAGSNLFTSSIAGAANNTRTGSILLNFNGKYVKRIQFAYYDSNGSGSLSMGAVMTGSSCNLDTDNDGIPNYLDTDSDGDGCPDAIEGAGNITTSQVTSGHINGGVDANGVPTAASGGQALGNSQNNALKDPACYNLALTNNTASGTSGTAFNIPTVLGNDTLDGVTPVIGSNPGQVAISQSGVWPSGITLNADGTVSVGAGVPSGTYNVTYQVCVNGTSPALCSTTTVTIDLALGCQAGSVSPVLHKN